MTVTYVTWQREASPLREVSRSLFGWRERRRQEQADNYRASRLAMDFRAACYGSGLTKDTASCAGISGVSIPRVCSVVLGETDCLLIQMTPGQLIEDYEKVAPRIASAMRFPKVRFRLRSQGYVWLELLTNDPLADLVPLPLRMRSITEPVLIGGLETGEQLSLTLPGSGHVIVQGQSRSGKTRWIYGFLSQLAGCSDVRITGSDSTTLIARAFTGTRHDQWASGTRDLEAHAELLESLVEEMDRRIEAMPLHLDVFPIDEENPFTVVVIEELAGLIVQADAHQSGTGSKKTKLSDRIRGAYSRLMGESAKAGFAVVLIIQRSDAGIVGGFARSNAAFGITFRVDEVSSIKMLHSQINEALAIEHTYAPAGIALVSGPELPMARFRSPFMPSYQHFLELVAEQSAYSAAA